MCIRDSAHSVEVTLGGKMLVCMRQISPSGALAIPCTAESVGLVKEYLNVCAGVGEFRSNTYTLSGHYARGNGWV